MSVILICVECVLNKDQSPSEVICGEAVDPDPLTAFALGVEQGRSPPPPKQVTPSPRKEGATSPPRARQPHSETAAISKQGGQSKSNQETQDRKVGSGKGA